ncbi:MAG: hypothetical protein JWP82_1697 [Humibacillus sp.]|nr:hypothetical protein [Humibacillus sp.]
MSAVTVGPARLTLDPDVGGSGWDVTVIEQRGGSAVVTHAADAVVVRLGDDADPDNPVARRTCCTTVSCESDGRVVVDASAAPPALLVRRAGVVLVPSTPGLQGEARLGPDERLLVLSAEAYDTLPPALVILLRELPDRVLGTDPAALLETLFEQVPAGCGALIAPAAVVPPALNPVRA